MGSLPPWAAPVGRLIDFLHCNNVKLETGKTTTFAERETMAMMHRAFYGFDDEFYSTHSMDWRTCLGHPCSGGTVANVEALWVARNTAYAECEKKGIVDANVDGVRRADATAPAAAHVRTDELLPIAATALVRLHCCARRPSASTPPGRARVVARSLLALESH